MSSLSTAALSFAVAAGLAGVLAETTNSDAVGHAPEFPLVALAWAQTNCGANLNTAPGTPRVQYEDFMRVSARYDALRASDGIDAACNRAVTSARRVASAE